jgi:hypothetical protein
MADALEPLLREKGSGPVSAAEKGPDPFSPAGPALLELYETARKR